MEQQLLTVGELAQRLRCSEATIWRAVKNEGLPAYRISARCVRFHWPTVERWLLRKRRIKRSLPPAG